MVQHKVFLVHHSVDIEVIKRYIIDPLESLESHHNLKVTCVYDSSHFTAGKTILGNISDCVKECSNIFVVLTKTALDRNWVKYETLLALEKSQQEGRLCITLILFDVDPQCAQDAGFGLLTNAMMIHVEPNRNDFENILLKRLIQEIREPRPLQPVRIAVNLSVGQAWSHYTGYAKIVLPELKQRICTSKWFIENRGRFPVMEFNLIPHTAKTVRYLYELNSSIKYEGDLDEIKADRGSFKGRPYKVPVYSIEDPEEKQRYYFVAQIPNSLSILNKLETQSISDDGQVPKFTISSGERCLQVARFYFIYNRLVNHPENLSCNDMITLVHYKDDCSVDQLLLKAVKEVCSTQTNLQQATQELEKVSIKSRPEADSCSDFQNTVYIDFHQDCSKDVETGHSVTEFLHRHNIKVWDNKRPGKTDLDNLKCALNESKWCVFVISSEALHKEDFRLLMFRCRAAMHRSIFENELRLIPVVDEITEEDIPRDICAVTYLSKQEPNYLHKLLNIIKCGSIKIEGKVSGRDVHQGLAWAYVLNYLQVTLKDHIERLKQIRENYPKDHVYTKLFIIVPSSCATKSLGALDKDENGHQIDERFKQLPEIHFINKAVGGVNRPYQLIPYKLQTDDMTYIVAVEYPNAVLCLKEMSEMSFVSGLEQQHLHDEAWKFKELAQNIIDTTPSVQNKAKLLYYDDSRLTVADAMLEVLRDEAMNFIL
ncbi:uncharacterized protein LOC132749004 [Ruditapes philippinarum]|uniref:uncharacterized protein LOC132749004 n=1 Tax=Ruditapes philippinarum TaxID=129788 RepID=UPI00295BA5C0|nr:uncharacterized protein LOC132749004 [Ruditapes philippinarum]